MKYVEVLLDLAVDKSLDYSVPAEFASVVRRGMRVEVPVQGRPRLGTIAAIKDNSTYPKVQPLLKVVSDQEVITEPLYDLALWISKYYCTSLRQVFKMVVPASIRRPVKPKEQLYVMRNKTREELANYCKAIREKSPGQAAVLEEMLLVKKGILLTELLEKSKTTRSPVDTLVKKGYLLVDIVRIDRSPLLHEEYFKTTPKKLNSAQQAALDKVVSAIERRAFETHLIYGITGSGKTEVYLQAIEKVLASGGGCIMLVPEISLTAQTIERFRSRFEGQIAILHHRLSDGEKLDEWGRIRNGEARIAIGARSAVFSPVVNLRLIIVDEEHEGSYKQEEEAPCYHARDIAVMRGKMENAVVMLGSATPSLESFYNAQKGKYILSALHQRADAAQLPTFTIVDMKKEYDRVKGLTNFSESLLDGIKRRVAAGEQTILFLNRRGYHAMLLCKKCAEVIKCEHCDTSLTFHKGENTLSCHLCGYTIAPPPQHCPKCKAPDPLRFRGVGTEQIERSLHAIFPEVRTLRMDGDTTRHKGSHQRLLREFGSGKADVLIGTQMIAKGLHFPQVTLVGIINCDPALQIPDFRSSEIAFQLITQVAGRAGRGQIAGEVILQTCLPDNPTLAYAARQDFDAFCKEELPSREMFAFPPFSQLVKCVLSSTNSKRALQYGHALRERLLGLLPADVEVHPLLPCGHSKVKDHFRYQFLVRGATTGPITRALTEVLAALPEPSGVKLLIDVNPLSTF